jgi:hypothetical protein
VGRPEVGVGEGDAEGVGLGEALGAGEGVGVGVGVGLAVVPLTEKDTDCCELAPLESQALITAVWFPEAIARETSIFPVVE